MSVLLCLLGIALFPVSVVVSPVMLAMQASFYSVMCNDAVPARILRIHRIDRLMCEITVAVDIGEEKSCRKLIGHHDATNAITRHVLLDKMLCSVLPETWTEGTEVTLLHNHVFQDRTCKRLAFTVDDSHYVSAWHEERSLVIYFGAAFVVFLLVAVLSR